MGLWSELAWDTLLPRKAVNKWIVSWNVERNYWDTGVGFEVYSKEISIAAMQHKNLIIFFYKNKTR